MREKGHRVNMRLNTADNDDLQQIIDKTGWSRSETVRFCLNFTHMILSTMPAEAIDAMFEQAAPPKQ